MRKKESDRKTKRAKETEKDGWKNITATDKSLVASNVLSQFTQHTTFSLHSFSSSGRTDLQKYSNSPSWSTDSKNVINITVGSGVQFQHCFAKLKVHEKKNTRKKDFSCSNTN